MLLYLVFAGLTVLGWPIQSRSQSRNQTYQSFLAFNPRISRLVSLSRLATCETYARLPRRHLHLLRLPLPQNPPSISLNPDLRNSRPLQIPPPNYPLRHIRQSPHRQPPFLPRLLLLLRRPFHRCHTRHPQAPSIFKLEDAVSGQKAEGGLYWECIMG